MAIQKKRFIKRSKPGLPRRYAPRNDKKNGFALVTFLIFLLILSLLASHAIQNSLLQHKMSYNFYLRDRLFYQTERVLAMAGIAIKSEEQLHCDISKQSIAANYVLQKDLASLPTCQVDSTGHYVVQKIHITPKISYYRVTAWVYDKDFVHTPILIQSIYAKIRNEITRFSWRMLYTTYQ